MNITKSRFVQNHQDGACYWAIVCKTHGSDNHCFLHTSKIASKKRQKVFAAEDGFLREDSAILNI